MAKNVLPHLKSNHNRSKLVDKDRKDWEARFLSMAFLVNQIFGDHANNLSNLGILQIFDLIWSKVQTVDGWQIIQED